MSNNKNLNFHPKFKSLMKERGFEIRSSNGVNIDDETIKSKCVIEVNITNTTSILSGDAVAQTFNVNELSYVSNTYCNENYVLISEHNLENFTVDTKESSWEWNKVDYIQTFVDQFAYQCVKKEESIHFLVETHMPYDAISC